MALTGYTATILPSPAQVGQAVIITLLPVGSSHFAGGNVTATFHQPDNSPVAVVVSLGTGTAAAGVLTNFSTLAALNAATPVTLTNDQALTDPAAISVTVIPVPTGPYSMIVALADAIRDALNASPSTFATAFTAATMFAPIADLAVVKATDLPLVYLVPISDPETRTGGGTTGLFKGEYGVTCVIYARVGVGTVAESACRPLMDLRKQIRDFFKVNALPVTASHYARASLQSVAGTPSFNRDFIIEKECFVSSQTLIFSLPGT